MISTRLRKHLMLAFFTGLAGAFSLLALDAYLADGIAIRNMVVGRDFANAWLGSQAVLRDQIDVLYNIEEYFRFQAETLSPKLSSHNFSYPPHTLLFLALLSPFEYIDALVVWTVASLFLFWLAARPYLATMGIPSILAPLLPASIVNVWAGHYGLLLGAGLLTAWRLCESHPRTAGIVFGLLTIKPHMGVLIPIILICRRQWSVITWASGTTLFLVIVSGEILGWQNWETYLTATSRYQADLLERSIEFYHLMMPTAYMSGRIIGLGHYSAALQAVSAAAGILAVLLVALRARDTVNAGLVAATATFLVLPYAFNYDMTVVSLSALMLLWSRYGVLCVVERILLSAAIALPGVVIYLNLFGLAVSPILLLGVLWIQVRQSTLIPGNEGDDGRKPEGLDHAASAPVAPAASAATR